MHLKEYEQETWHRGHLMAFSGIDGPTRHRDELVVRTELAPPGLEIMMPQTCRIVFQSEPISDILVTSDFFQCATATGSIRGAFLDCDHLLIEGDCRIENASPEIAIRIGDGCLLVGMAKRFRPELIESSLDATLLARSQWLRGLTFCDTLPPATRKTLFHACSMMKGQVYAPDGCIQTRWTTPDRWPHADMWLWDSAFHAIGLRHLDPALAMNAISAMFDTQRPDGFLPHQANINGPVSNITQPPILAFAAKLVHEKSKNTGWLQSLYPKLSAYVKWDFLHRDSDGGGLTEWIIEDNPICRSGESGMDNSPRFDEATLLDAVDFNSFLALECESLAEIALLLDQPSEHAYWSFHHQRLCELINERLWSEVDGFYFDFNPEKQQRTEVWSSAGFLPLVCGACSKSQAEKLAEALTDPERFGTALPIPSIAANSGHFYSKDMWRGPVWMNINWLVVFGLQRYGLHDASENLRSASIRGIEKGWKDFGVFFEFFDDRNEVAPPNLLRKRICDPRKPFNQVIHDFGWTATCYVDFVLSHHRSSVRPQNSIVETTSNPILQTPALA